MKIALDAMGGDHAPSVALAGAIRAVTERHLPVVLVGQREVIAEELARQNAQHLDLPIVHASEVIAMDEHPSAAVKAKPDSSMAVGMRLLKRGEVSAFVSMGNTGGMLAAGVLLLGRIRGVRRPALSTIFPTLQGHCLLLDIGANADCKPEYLRQFAIMGATYAERVLGIRNPRTGLISNGEEESKGSELVQAAHQKLRHTPGLNFIGNVEGKDIFEGTADVIVTDGFTGNVIIKLSEGMGNMIKTMLREEFRRNPLAMLGGWLGKGALARFAQRTDYSEIGGAPLLGLEGVVIVGHGRSNAKAVMNALTVAHRAVEQKVVPAIRAGIEDTVQGGTSANT
ncbi:MAG: phosphate acyltransferase PlsX [Chloroflexi bacterium]|nr:phosphate acyltransferase PlsX [Chloroflexota bacterium]